MQKTGYKMARPHFDQRRFTRQAAVKSIIAAVGKAADGLGFNWRSDLAAQDDPLVLMVDIRHRDGREQGLSVRMHRGGKKLV